MQLGNKMSAKPLFNTAVDELDPIIVSRSQLLKPTGTESDDTYGIFTDYHRFRHDVKHTRLLMAISIGFDKYAKEDAQELPANTNVCGYALTLVKSAETFERRVDPDLLYMILERAKNFESDETPFTLLRIYARTDEPIVARITRTVLEKTVGMICTHQTMDNFANEARRDINLTHAPPVSTELIAKLQVVRKTWVPLGRIASVKPARQSKLSSKVRGIFSSKAIA